MKKFVFSLRTTTVNMCIKRFKSASGDKRYEISELRYIPRVLDGVTEVELLENWLFRVSWGKVQAK